jgi:hypothetical protein
MRISEGKRTVYTALKINHKNGKESPFIAILERVRVKNLPIQREVIML